MLGLGTEEIPHIIFLTEKGVIMAVCKRCKKAVNLTKSVLDYQNCQSETLSDDDLIMWTGAAMLQFYETHIAELEIDRDILIEKINAILVSINEIVQKSAAARWN